MVQIKISRDNSKSPVFLKIFTGFAEYFLGNDVVTPDGIPERRR
jgi:hypothetical protein